jgi:hypothetical protein
MVPDNGTFGLRFEKEVKDGHIEGLADLVQRVDGGAGHTALYLADKAGGHAGALGQIALAQAQLFTPGADSVSQWQHAHTSSLVIAHAELLYQRKWLLSRRT